MNDLEFMTCEVIHIGRFLEKFKNVEEIPLALDNG